MGLKFDQYTKENPTKALKFLKRAFVKKNPVAAYKLGKFYRDGKYVKASQEKALDLLSKAVLWSLSSSYNDDCHVRAMRAIQDIKNADNEKAMRIELGDILLKDEIIHHLNRFYAFPFIGKTKAIAGEMMTLLSDVFRNDVSYKEVKTLIESKNDTVFTPKMRTLINAMNTMYEVYPILCKKFNVAPRALHGLNLLDVYPYPSFEVVEKICEDVVTMFLTMIGTEESEICEFSFLIPDEKFLDKCEESKDSNIQIFMISIIEVKLEIEDYLSNCRYLYKMCLKRYYNKVAEKLEEVKKCLSPFETTLNFEVNNIKNIIPYSMFDDTEITISDDFDKLLQEFIDSELNETNSNLEEVNSERNEFAIFDEDEMKNTDSPSAFNIRRTNIAYDFTTENVVPPTKRTHFRKSEGENLHIDFVIDNPNYNKECWGFDAVVELVSDSGVVWEKKQITTFIESDEQLHTLRVTMNNLKLPEGAYCLVLYRDNEAETTIRIYIVEIPEPYTKCINFGGFGIYRINSDSDDPYSYSLEDRDCQSCFNVEGLEGVFIVTHGENILPHGYHYQLILRIYNELGVEIVCESNEESIGAEDSNDKILHINEHICRKYWEKGTYRAEVEFFGEVIASGEFVIGDKDIRAAYHKNNVQPKTNIGGREIVRNVQNPLAKLNDMVGLKDVKKEVQQLLSKAEIDKKRTINGLKTKQMSLHAAFMGNPGTGKTTVAKLLGQIYKDMGLLSKGHVVVEERATLTGQNWNSECDLTNKAMEKAKGGILFIDEAYDLVTDHPQDPGRLIISTLLSSLADENNRDWMLILAGYPAPMEKLLNVNDGFRSRLQKFHFKDFDHKELIHIADSWLEHNDYKMTDEAHQAFEALVSTAAAQKDKHFGNARYVCDLLEKQIVPAMSTRLMTKGIFDSIEVLKTIEYADIPNINQEEESGENISKLEAMIGLGTLKGKINSHLDFIRFVNMRRDSGIATIIPPLHMIFAGNPGTGKTTVADYLGEIYKSMGLLSVGRVVKVSRADMVGRYGDTEQTMKTLLSTAKGNILFIDEAYTLFSQDNPNDPGKRAVEMLLDTLGKESIDMIVIMAGYPKEMEDLLNSNQGLAGRFPYKFEFEDYSVDDLLKIAKGVCDKNNLILPKEAKEAITAVIKKEYRVKDAHFSNARFVVRLITTQIMPNMGSRITKITGQKDEAMLKTILQEDVPITIREVKHINNNLFDEEIIKIALDKLDNLVGLTQVKRAVHEFVDVAREMSLKHKKFIGRYPLKWSFAGNTGTGKSTVAEILSEILKGMYLLGKGHLVEVKAEELYAVNTHQADELLKRRMKESQQGLLFVDGDAPQFRSPESRYNPDYLRMCLAANTVEMPGTYAIVIAEYESPRQRLVQSLAQVGITDFDHTLVFDNYSKDELVEILKRHLLKDGLTLEPGAETIMQKYIAGLCEGRRADYANARTMKLLARSIHKLTLISRNDSGRVTAVNVAEFALSQPVSSTRIGY